MKDDRHQYEADLIACCAIIPSMTGRVKESHFSRGAFQTLFQEIKRKGIDAFEEMKGLEEYEQDFLREKYDRIIFMPEDEQAHIVKYAIRVIEKHQVSQGNQRKLEKAISLIENGYINEAVVEAKGLKFYTDKEFKTTKEHMIDSVNESNGILTGIDAFDSEMNGLLMGNMFAICGDSGQMKTMWSLWLQIQLLVENPGLKAAYFEKEMLVKDVARRLLAMFLHKDLSEIMGIANMPDDEKERAKKEVDRRVHEEMENGDNKYSDAINRITLVPPDMFNDALDIWEIIEGLNVDIWALDFVTMLGAESSSDDTYQFVSRQLSILKDMTTSTQTLGIPLSQLKQNTVDTRTIKVPKLSDMEYGSKLKQYAAYVFAMFYPNYYYRSWNPKDFFAVSLKTRHGKQLTVPFQVHPTLCYYEEMKGRDKHSMMTKFTDYVTIEKT